MPMIASTLRSEPPRRAAQVARARLDAGFDALVLAAPLDRQDWEALAPLLPRDSVLAVELFVPLPRGVASNRLRPGVSSPFALGSLNREVKRDAERHGPTTLSFADHQGARYVLLPRVSLDDGEFRLRAKPAATGEEPRFVRPPEASAHLDSYLSTLDRLLGAAERYDVTLAVTPAGSPAGMPDLDDAALILAEFRGAPLCLWPDTAEHTSAGEDAPWRRFAPVPGVTLGGLSRSGDSVDWPRLLSDLEDVPRWVVDPTPGAEAGEVAGALEFLRSQLEPEAPDPLFPG